MDVECTGRGYSVKENLCDFAGEDFFQNVPLEAEFFLGLLILQGGIVLGLFFMFWSILEKLEKIKDD